MPMFGRTRRENEDQTPTFWVTYGLRDPGISDLRCPRMEEVLRAPAAHGVSSIGTVRTLLSAGPMKIKTVSLGIFRLNFKFLKSRICIFVSKLFKHIRKISQLKFLYYHNFFVYKSFLLKFIAFERSRYVDIICAQRHCLTPRSPRASHPQSP